MPANAPLHIVILAAGEGKRMNSTRPKVLMPLAGRPMLAHVLETARALRPARIQIVYGHLGDQVRAAATDLNDLTWVHQTERLGTGHALQVAISDVPDGARLLVLYGDVPLIGLATLRSLVAIDAELIALVTMLDAPFGYGRVVRDGIGRVRAIVEERDCTAEQRALTCVNTGILVGDSASLRGWLNALRNDNSQREYYLTDIYAMATDAGRPASASICVNPQEVFGANDPWQLAGLERIYQRQRATELASQGVRFSDPVRYDQRGSVSVGRDVEIDIDVILEGQVELDDDVSIGPFCRIRDSRLGPGTRVLAHCDLDGIVTAGHCTIGPFARLRPGTQIEEGAHVGNFVELKKTRLGAGSKANHLSYIGDADVGANVNIGAGTITCNYDGADKHLTRIEDGVFIGSNSSLVAPVTIGKDATIGAGSVINRNAPPGELSVARSRQGVVQGWKRPSKTP